MSVVARPEAQSLPLSAIVLTFNSDRTLSCVLDSLRFCAEIVIVDSGSTDSTLAIAEKHSCRIHQRKLDGFGEQKDFAVSKASHDWVFVVDSDEVVPDDMETEIREIFKDGPPAPGAFRVPNLLYFLGKPLRFSGFNQTGPIRLFHRGVARFNHAKVHELVIPSTPPLQMKAALKHFSYLSLEDYFKKFNLYTSSGAIDLMEKTRQGMRYRVILSLPVHFMKHYFFKLGILDGYPGFLWSLLSALYPVVKYAKYEELLRKA